MPEVNNSPYIIAAYVVTWLVLLAYLARLVVTARRARERLDAQMKTRSDR